jgi:MoxR-like ATPase
MARNPLASILASLSDAEARALIVSLYHGTLPPAFDPAAHTAPSIVEILNAWLAAGSIAPHAIMLAAAPVIARRVPPAPAMPAPPAAPVYRSDGLLNGTPLTAPSIPVFIPPAQPAPAPVAQSPQITGAWVNELTAESAPSSLHAAIVAAVEETAPEPAPIAPAPVKTPPNVPTKVSARSLFADQPQSVINAIPQALSVIVYNSPDAPLINPIYAFDGANLAAALASLACTPSQNVWLGGPRGTGKTEFVRQLAARLGRPFFRVNFNRSTESADFLGDIGLKSGDTAWQDGPATTARRTPGAILLLDEITYGAQGHLAALNPVLERNGEPLRLPRTGERLAPADHTAIFAADNTFGHGDTSGEYIARSAMGGDTLDRFARFLKFDYLPADVERKVLRSMVQLESGERPSSAMARNVCTLMRVARAKADLGELSGAPSLRRAAAFCVALVQGFDAPTAYADTIVRAAPEDSQEALRQIYAATWPHDANASAPAVDPNANPFAHTPGEQV